MSRKIKSSSSAWICVHIFYPTTPFIIEGLIRFLSNGCSVVTNTFSASKLAMSIAMMSLFINKSIINADPALENDADREDRNMAQSIFLMYGLFGAAMFSALVLMDALIEFQSVKILNVKETFQWFVYTTCWFPICHAVMVQRSFKLRSR